MQKTALVTGGNKGIGLEVTKAFLALNYDVIILARDFKNFELSTHPNVKTIVFDLIQVDAIPALIASLPAIDILINNAGIMYAIPYQNYKNDHINTMLKINLEAPVKLIEEVAKTMLEKGGRIVNNTSIAGQIGHPDIWYGITKAGLINATKSFSKIFEGKIIINAVAPSPVATDMLNTIPQARQEAFLKSVISKRFAQPEEIAKTIVWLSTESPEYINGTVIDINNGSFPR
ncbi:SDR family NAD(P)-dependent oxidoreductase [Sulfurospirillum diekertiae]|uniref:3-oxoacyl-[acyl-carrier-protein] reductase FabG n=1 Tax=Sulfurospirillum diekertiae TaxID=1854492 RepID=A0A1Y0HRY0_9BACT|nr:SDR family oxidoreductase [Sulfurospirillum diekertiae]ARU50064.1 3-oxoacyl-[acyl-carrier-protein] reductase FabG [Sulfurospirillum diekertiae]ASC94852.1 3-oxoacyl-[acyl-carrier-protein] reductase FabG [Sulfurospirillum diekertiae]